MHAHIGGELIATKEMLRKSEMEVADLKIKLEAAQKQFTAELSAAREGLEQTKIALAQETTKAVDRDDQAVSCYGSQEGGSFPEWSGAWVQSGESCCVREVSSEPSRSGAITVRAGL